VIQLITKVEAKSSQLDALRKQIKEAALSGTSPAQMQQRDLEREQLSTELTQLSEALRVALDEYEAETGSQLMYMGRPYNVAAVRNKKKTTVSPQKRGGGGSSWK